MDRERQDRDRLKEVHQTDLTESRVNQDFVDWLKNKGPTWLLAILVAVCVYLGVVRLRQAKESKRHEAWSAFYAAELPGSYEDVARDYAKIGGLQYVARLAAADSLMRAVQSGRPLGSAADAPVAPDPETWPEERDRYLVRAADHYEGIVAEDDGGLGMAIHVVSAMNGRAAVAESRGNGAEAATWYNRAAERAEADYPALATLARSRAASADANSTVVDFPADADVLAITGEMPPVAPARIIDALRTFVLPPDDESADD